MTHGQCQFEVISNSILSQSRHFWKFNDSSERHVFPGWCVRSNLSWPNHFECTTGHFALEIAGNFEHTSALDSDQRRIRTHSERRETAKRGWFWSEALSFWYCLIRTTSSAHSLGWHERALFSHFFNFVLITKKKVHHFRWLSFKNLEWKTMKHKKSRRLLQNLLKA